MYLYKRALDNQIIINEFLKLLMESSVDCSIHRSKTNIKNKIKCNICVPTNSLLYLDNLDEDLVITNPCKVEKNIDKMGSKITAKELILDGNIKVYYSIDDIIKDKKSPLVTLRKKPLLERIHVYKYDSSIDGYIEMNENNELYPQIIEKIMLIKSKK